AAVVAVLEHLRQRELQDLLVEANGPLDVVREQRHVVDAPSGRCRPLGSGPEVTAGDLGPARRGRRARLALRGGSLVIARAHGSILPCARQSPDPSDKQVNRVPDRQALPSHHVVDDLDAMDAWYDDVFSVHRFYRGYEKLAGREASLLTIGDVVL